MKVTKYQDFTICMPFDWAILLLGILCKKSDKCPKNNNNTRRNNTCDPI